MCILFIDTGMLEESDYSFILASNRDEDMERPAVPAAPWAEDHNVIGGRDMKDGREGGTWLAISPTRGKAAILLNLSGKPKTNPKARGNIVADYVKSSIVIDEYVKTLSPYAEEYNDFHMVAVEFGKENAKVHSYNNVSNLLERYDGRFLGFGNSLPKTPLKKVESGCQRFSEICKKWPKVEDKMKLTDELIDLLKWKEKHLPDPELKRRLPNDHEALSSVFVSIPSFKYGTRTHTIILVTKFGRIDFVEVTMNPNEETQGLEPADWLRTDLTFDI